MPEVMISYSRKDSEFVRRLHQALHLQKREGWVDWEGIPLTADWWREICQAIESADTFLFVISPDSLASPVCHLEIDHARRHNKRLVPIIRRAADPAEAFGILAALPTDSNMQARLGGRNLLAVAQENWRALSRHHWLSFDQDADFTANFQRLIAALDMDLEYVRQHTRLLIRAKEWDSAKRIGASLLRGEELAAAQQWLSTSGGKDPGPSELHTHYIFESAQEQQKREQAEREQQARELRFQKRAANRARYLAGVSALAAVIGIGLSIFAFSQFTRAQDEADSRATQEGIAVAAAATADRRAVELQSLFLAGAAQELTGDPLGLTLALEAVNIENPPGEAQRALAEAAYPGGIAYEFPIHIRTGDSNADAGPTSLVEFSALSADGRWAVADYYDRDDLQTYLMLWDTQTRTRRDIALGLGENNYVSDVVFNPNDSSQLALLVAGRDASGLPTGWVEIMDLEDGLQTSYANPGFTAFEMVWSASGHLYILENVGSTLRVWDATEQRAVIEVGSDLTGPATLSGDGRRLGYVDLEGTLEVVDVASGERIYEGLLATQVVALNDDGSRLAMAYRSVVVGHGGVMVIDLATGATLYDWDWPNQTLRDMDFDASGRTLAVGAYNSGGTQPSLRVWDTETGDELITSAASFDVQGVSISADGQWVLTSTNQITRRNNLVLWATRPADELLRTQLEFAGARWAVNFRADGGAVVVTNQAGTEGEPLGVEIDLASGVETAQTDGAVSPIPPDGQSANGQFRATSTLNADLGYVELRLENAAGDELAMWPLPNDPFGSFSKTVTASNDGRQVAVGGCDEFINTSTEECGRANVRIFEVGQDSPRILAAHSAGITALAWSPDGRYLVSGDDTLLIVVWDVQSGTAVRYFRGHNSPETSAFNQIRALAVSPDGQTVASLEYAGTLIVWRVDALAELVAWARANRYARELTCNERLRYRIEPYCAADYVVPTSTPFVR